MPDRDNAEVTYTVRELLAEIKAEQIAGFTRIETSMASKADQADVARIDERLDEHGRVLDSHGERIGGIEGREHDREVAANVHSVRDQRTFTFRQKALGALATLALIVATALSSQIPHLL